MRRGFLPAPEVSHRLRVVIMNTESKRDLYRVCSRRVRETFTGVPHVSENASPQDPTVGLCPGS